MAKTKSRNVEALGNAPAAKVRGVPAKRPLSKPVLATGDVLKFAEARAKTTTTTTGKSGLVPEGDVRLTANIRGDLHMKLKIRAVQERTTIGELIEQWIDGWR